MARPTAYPIAADKHRPQQRDQSTRKGSEREAGGDSDQRWRDEQEVRGEAHAAQAMSGTGRGNQVCDQRAREDRLIGIGRRSQRLRRLLLFVTGQLDPRERVVGLRSRIDERTQRARPLDAVRDSIRIQTEMFRDQPIANVANAIAHARSTAGFDRHITFTVNGHRSPRQIGRPDSHELIVHDHHFGVNEGRNVGRAVRPRGRRAAAAGAYPRRSFA